MSVTNCLIVGVGGQGILLASNLLCEAAFESGFDVKKSEVHGMSQRGGSVFSHVRWGEKVYSPVIPYSKADYIISFEEMETLRWCEYAHKDTIFIINSIKIPPISVSRGEMHYPEKVTERIKESFNNVYSINASEEAEKLGNTRTTNTIMLGALSTCTKIDAAVWPKAIEQLVASKYLDINKKAFEIGTNLI